MKLSFAARTILALRLVRETSSFLETTTTTSTKVLFSPPRISYDQLLVNGGGGGDVGGAGGVNDPLIWSALQDVGMISITNIPSLNKQTTLQLLEECLMSSPNEDRNRRHTKNDQTDLDENESVASGPVGALRVFSDGTHRRTLATRTLAGSVEPLLLLSSSSSASASLLDASPSCIALEESSETFRRAIQTVSDAMGGVLARWVSHQTTTASSSTTDGNHPHTGMLQDSTGKSYTIEQIIKEGEHLEHFHCYYGNDNVGSDAIPSINDNDDDINNGREPTIDWHTDQGMMLFFSPGQRNGRATDGLSIQLLDGSAVEVQFDTDYDDVVVMLGDGVDLYVNPTIRDRAAAVVEDDSASDNPHRHPVRQLRPVPHALHMPRNGGTSSTDRDSHRPSPRVWYGRMVLPPPQALYPMTTSTFEEIRMSIIEQDPTAIALGCSGVYPTNRILIEAPDDITCNVTSQLYCWHQCMNHTDYDVSPDGCSEQGLDLGCVNEDGFLWTDRHDPTFFIGCVDLVTAGEYHTGGKRTTTICLCLYCVQFQFVLNVEKTTFPWLLS
jgi:hypothetical protein